MTFDHSKLKGLLREKGMTQDDLAKAVGLSPSGLNLKMNGKLGFRVDEVYSICVRLGIDDPIPYFFTPKYSNFECV